MNKIRIKSVTNVRGFLKALFEIDNEKIEFSYNDNGVYENIVRRDGFISKLIHKRIFDYFGVFKKVKICINEDIAFSYNRILKSNKPYVLYLENPLAIVHYCIYRPYTFASKIRLKKAFKDPNLKGIVCLSKACKETIRNYYDIPNTIPVLNIYPYVNFNKPINEFDIEKRAYRDIINCLYISSDFSLKGGREIIRSIKNLNRSDIEVFVITREDTIPNEDKKIIKSLKTVKIIEFNLSKEELAEYYLNSNILLNPSRQDSFSLVVLEAMKTGNAILSSDIYAIPEMVTDGVEGYLGKVKYQFWNENRMPNPDVWNNRKNTIYSDYIDYPMIDFLSEKLVDLVDHRELLSQLQKNAYIKSNSGEFSDNFIVDAWSDLFSSCLIKEE